MRIATREQAAQLGPLAVEAWDREMRAAVPAIIRGDVLPADTRPQESRRRSKLEVAFEERAKVEYGDKLYYEPIKLRLAGRCFLTPDFLTARGIEIFWETKGPFAREDSIIKLKQAAEKYPCFGFVLVTRPARSRWECRWVNGAGINQKVWVPDWLR